MKQLILGFAFRALLVLLASSGGAHARTLYQWVQLGPGGASARAITDDDTCPTVTVDGADRPMATRSDPGQTFRGSPGALPVATFTARGCEITIEATAVAASIGDVALPLPRPNPGRIVILGDTGCRLEKDDPIQDCNEPDGEHRWPFPRLAAAAATSRPDLIIHVGDYHYREMTCPADHPGCAGSPPPYGWAAWEADFFSPARPLLAAAPWIMTRGNHEDVGRAGEGWSRFLAAAPATGVVKDLTGAWLARLGDFGVIVLDSGHAVDPMPKCTQEAGIYQDLAAQLRPVVAAIPAETWLTTHRPFNAMRGDAKRTGLEVENCVLQRALGSMLSARLRMIVSGHIHFFQALDFGGGRPAQLVAGTGGDNLEPMPPVPVEGQMINGATVVHAITHSGFGYIVWDRNGPGAWSGVVFDDRGKPFDRCRLEQTSLRCGL
jgi:Calcineurin-like phosphoesterase